MLANSLPPALFADDARGYAGPLNEVRDRAAQLAADLDQLESASDGLARVQRLIGRLRDAAVVGLDLSLQPAQRAALQRQVDLLLAEIDTVADDTRIDERLLRGGRGPTEPAARASSDGPVPGEAAPFRAIGTAILGLAGLAVRSSDQAAVATSGLDRATSRLQRTGRALGATTARVQQAFKAVTDPPTTVAGDPAIRGETSALGSTMMLRSQLVAHPQQAAQSQAALDAARVRWLLDDPAS